MEKYIEQLLEDLGEAADQGPGPGTSWNAIGEGDFDEEDPIADVEQFLYGPEQKLSEIVGIEKIQFPPKEKLSEKQMSKLFNAMVDLLNVFHFVPDFPDGVPVSIKYQLLRENWDSKQVYVGGGGETHIEFCDYEPDECPFPRECCDCLRWHEEHKNRRYYSDDDPGEDKDWPF